MWSGVDLARPRAVWAAGHVIVRGFGASTAPRSGLTRAGHVVGRGFGASAAPGEVRAMGGPCFPRGSLSAVRSRLRKKEEKRCTRDRRPSRLGLGFWFGWR